MTQPPPSDWVLACSYHPLTITQRGSPASPARESGLAPFGPSPYPRTATQSPVSQLSAGEPGTLLPSGSPQLFLGPVCESVPPNPRLFDVNVAPAGFGPRVYESTGNKRAQEESGLPGSQRGERLSTHPAANWMSTLKMDLCARQPLPFNCCK